MASNGRSLDTTVVVEITTSYQCKSVLTRPFTLVTRVYAQTLLEYALTVVAVLGFVLAGMAAFSGVLVSVLNNTLNF
jgi:hypothetical protein